MQSLFQYFKNFNPLSKEAEEAIIDISSKIGIYEVLLVALQVQLPTESLAVSIILSHNHPSGNLKPSGADEELTQKIKLAASNHDIKVIYRIIITSEWYYSFLQGAIIALF